MQAVPIVMPQPASSAARGPAARTALGGGSSAGAEEAAASSAADGAGTAAAAAPERDISAELEELVVEEQRLTSQKRAQACMHTRAVDVLPLCHRVVAHSLVCLHSDFQLSCSSLSARGVTCSAPLLYKSRAWNIHEGDPLEPLRHDLKISRMLNLPTFCRLAMRSSPPQ